MQASSPRPRSRQREEAHLQRMIDKKNAAIAALPRRAGDTDTDHPDDELDLRGVAMESHPRDTFWPKDWCMPTWTMPIKGWSPEAWANDPEVEVLGSTHEDGEERHRVSGAPRQL